MPAQTLEPSASAAGTAAGAAPPAAGAPDAAAAEAAAAQAGPVPRDARIIALILASMGIDDAEPAVLLMLLEFAHQRHMYPQPAALPVSLDRYTTDILSDALLYADHSRAGGSAQGPSLDDVQLAIQAKVNHEFTQPMPKEMLLSLATSLNSTPLPPISDRYGVRLPPPQHTLANINYSVVPNAPPPLDEDSEAEADENEEAAETKARTAQDARTRGGSIGEEDGEDVRAEGDETTQGAQPMAVDAARGTKRALEEDEDYD